MIQPRAKFALSELSATLRHSWIAPIEIRHVSFQDCLRTWRKKKKHTGEELVFNVVVHGGDKIIHG